MLKNLLVIACCFGLLTACTVNNARYPTSYTGGPPPVASATTAQAIVGPQAPFYKRDHGFYDENAPAHKQDDKRDDKYKAHAHHQQHQSHQQSSTAPVDIYANVMEKMHAGMSAYTATGDADTDFVLGMIPHHQGAVDMAQLVLEHGDDPHIRRLARDVIVAQRREIAFMKYWLQTRGALTHSNISNVNVDAAKAE